MNHPENPLPRKTEQSVILLCMISKWRSYALPNNNDKEHQIYQNDQTSSSEQHPTTANNPMIHDDEHKTTSSDQLLNESIEAIGNFFMEAVNSYCIINAADASYRCSLSGFTESNEGGKMHTR